MVTQVDRSQYACYILVHTRQAHAFTSILDRHYQTYQESDWGGGLVLLSAFSCTPQREDLLRAILPIAQSASSVIYMPLMACSSLPQRCISDLDGTLIRNELLIDLAHNLGLGADFEALTYQTIAGSIGFVESLSRRTQLLHGIEVSALSALHHGVIPALGLECWLNWCRHHGISIDIATGNFDTICLSLREVIPFEHYCASQAEIEAGKLTGRLISIVDAGDKADFCYAVAEAHQLSPKALLAIGDGANDIPMLCSVGHACLYHGHGHGTQDSIAISSLIELIVRHSSPRKEPILNLEVQFDSGE